MIKWLLMGAGVAVLLAVAGRNDAGALAGLDNEQLGAVVVLGATLLLVVSGMASYRGGFGRALRDMVAWVCLALALVTGYSFRHDLTALAWRVAGELAPPGQSILVDNGEAGERAVRIRRRGDGHFVARAEVNGNHLTMLVDTGATTVVLKPNDAQAAGIDLKSLSYTVPVQTANGTAYAAPVRLRGIAIGPIMVPQVEALVAKPGTLKESLLGISFLRRLRSFEFAGDFLTLRS